MKFLKLKIKKRWEAYLKRLGKVNKKLYGDGRLECCDLNKSNKK